MALDPAAESERVRRKYAHTRASEIALYTAGLVVLAIGSLFREVGWFVYAGMVSGAAGWELVKLRLRRNAQRFAEVGQRHPLPARGSAADR